MYLPIQSEQMQLENIPDILQIEKENFLFPWTQTNFMDCIKSAYICRVWRLQKELLAYAIQMIILEEAQLLNINVKKMAQKQGIGRAVLREMMDLAKQSGANQMLLEVRISNQRAIDLYQKIGFNEIAIRHAYYPALRGREDALLMGAML